MSLAVPCDRVMLSVVHTDAQHLHQAKGVAHGKPCHAGPLPREYAAAASENPPQSEADRFSRHPRAALVDACLDGCERAVARDKGGVVSRPCSRTSPL